ncbi:hypothetical protein PROFUN_00552 [Planoprotostelium fungivorum]|uniref:GAF domain-containing protein n=1 Tax=Planoprotostelium fungivorum TaxID=1890364 RepID=A0A2P6N186_9EUKA|nr:hypothetical protein PROFUN_00552 [Planoprotostelium fungivorum]
MNSETLNQLVKEGVEERVTVNQRALIDKLLARYKGHFTVFRELIQNADDAKAKTIRVRLTHDEQHGRSVIVENDGMALTQNDWNRLIRIAEGNPNEEATGCFGVGFYSVFSITEHPIIQSKGTTLAFVWDKDQLTTFKRENEEGDRNGWTIFNLPIRDKNLIIDPFDLTKYLCQTLSFTNNLTRIDVYQDDNLMYSTTKEIIHSSSSLMDNLNRKVYSTEKLLKLNSLVRHRVRFSAKDHTKEGEGYSTEVEQLEAKVNVTLDEGLENQMIRILGKRFPEESKIRLIFDGQQMESSTIEEQEREEKRGEDDWSEGEEVKPEENSKKTPRELLSEISPYPNRGRIFIGFSSHQTTGSGYHLAAQFIPTVERENVDFNDFYFKRWNSDVITMAGQIARIHYDEVMGKPQPVVNKSQKKKNRSQLQPPVEKKEMTDDEISRRRRVMSSCSLSRSSPATEVSTLLAASFYNAPDGRPLYVLAVPPSKPGIFQVFSSREIFMPLYGLERFHFISVAMAPAFATNRSSRIPGNRQVPWNNVDIFAESWQVVRFYDELKERKEIKVLGMKDMISQLDDTILNESQLGELLSWWITNYNALDVEISVPQDTLPRVVSQRFGEKSVLESAPLQLKPLPLFEWFSNLLPQLEAMENMDVCVNAIAHVSTKWNKLNPNEKRSIVSLAEDHKIIPTKFSTFDYPKKVYLPQNQISFDDLPEAHESLHSQISTKFLKELGLRSAPDAKFVLSKMGGPNHWDSRGAIQFLMQQEASLDEQDWSTLRSSSILPSTHGKKLVTASELLLPAKNGEFEGMDVPMISWKDITSGESAFLQRMGMRDSPNLNVLLKLCTRKDGKAFDYLLNQFDSLYKKDYKNQKKENLPAFVPTINGSLAKPEECFWGSVKRFSDVEMETLCNYLGVWPVSKEYSSRVARLGVGQNPHPSVVVTRLTKNPAPFVIAKLVFDYASTFQGNFTHSDWKVLSSHPIIPPYPNTRGGFLLPHQVIVGGDAVKTRYGNLIDYIDDQYTEGAKMFLRMCGSPENLNTQQLVRALMKNGQKHLSQDGFERYLSTLQEISFGMDRVPQDLRNLMEKSSIFLSVWSHPNDGSREKDTTGASLSAARDCVLVDNTDYASMFKIKMAASNSPSLEKMYESMGSPWLSSLIKETSQAVGQPKSTSRSIQISEMVKEKMNLLLNDLGTCREREGTKKNARQLLEGISVVEVNAVKKILTLGHQKKEIETNVCSKVSGDKATLYITHQVSQLSIASELAQLLLLKKVKEDDLKFFAILSSDLSTLRQQGYPIDRLIPANRSHTGKQPISVQPEKTPIEVEETRNVVENSHAIETEETRREEKRTRHIVQKVSTDMNRMNDMLTKAVNSTPTHKNTQNIKTIGENIIETHCENREEHNLHLLTCFGQINVYVEADIQVSESQLVAAKSFSQVLQNLSSVFSIPNVKQTVCIFVDETSTIAFNAKHRLHFNLLYYERLHHNKDPLDVYFFWYSTMCHEIAHNIEEGHNASHSYYTEQLACLHFQKFHQTLEKWREHPPSAPSNSENGVVPHLTSSKDREEDENGFVEGKSPSQPETEREQRRNKGKSRLVCALHNGPRSSVTLIYWAKRRICTWEAGKEIAGVENLSLWFLQVWQSLGCERRRRMSVELMRPMLHEQTGRTSPVAFHWSDDETETLEDKPSNTLGDEPFFSGVIDYVHQIFKAPLAGINVSEGDRRYNFSLAGSDGLLSLAEMQLDCCPTLCSYAVHRKEMIVSEDTTQCPILSRHPLVTGGPNLRFYVSIPLVVDDEIVGSLCMADFQPRKFSEKERTDLKSYAETVVMASEVTFLLYVSDCAQKSKVVIIGLSGIRLGAPPEYKEVEFTHFMRGSAGSWAHKHIWS